MGSFYGEELAVSQRDAGALVETLSIIQPFEPEVVLTSGKSCQEPIGDMTEFCIGGPDSNPRTKVHLEKFLTGIQAHSFQDEGYRLEIKAGARSFKYERNRKEYAVLANILIEKYAKPLFLICGQTSIANKCALHYLRMNYDTTLHSLFGQDQFCLITQVIFPNTYGHKMVEFVADITDIAFPDVGKKP